MAIKEIKLDLAPELRKLDVYSRRDVLSKTMEGEWSTVFKGRGIEFAGFRVYQYGDDASLIDWKASLRANDTLIREFEEFKNFTVFFLFDVSDSMLFTSTDKLKCEFAAELIYVLADAINKGGDAVGMAMFNDDFVNKIYPDIGAEILNRVRSNISDPKNYGGGFNFKKALMLTRSLLQKKAVVIIVSDFIGLGDGWERYVEMMSEDFELIALMVRDRRDIELPRTGGQYMLKNPFSDENIYIDVKHYSKLYKEKMHAEIMKMQNIFVRCRGDFLLLPTDEEPLGHIVKFFQKRSKRQD